MLPGIKVDFLLTGMDEAQDEITSRLGIVPSRTWKLGDSIQGTKLLRKQNGWCLSSNRNYGSIDLDEQLTALIIVLIPKSTIIAQLCAEFGLEPEFSCAINIHNNETPIINLTRETISALARLNAELDIDLIITG